MPTCIFVETVHNKMTIEIQGRDYMPMLSGNGWIDPHANYRQGSKPSSGHR